MMMLSSSLPELPAGLPSPSAAQDTTDQQLGSVSFETCISTPLASSGATSTSLQIAIAAMKPSAKTCSKSGS